MADAKPADDSGSAAAQVPAESAPPRQRGWSWLAIRQPTPLWQGVLFGILCIAICFGLWWFLTLGESEERFLTSDKLPSPRETFSKPMLHELWFDRALSRNVIVTLERVVLGFGLAVVIGVPLGILAGCYSRFAAFLAPLVLFGRNIPLAAIIPLTIFFFGIGELRTIMFIFIACVAFVVSDAAQAIMDIDMRYIETAYTLGAKRRHVVLKVLTPLAMPAIFNSLRLMFGLAFGYIMLAELFVVGGDDGGLGYLISVSQRRGPREHIYLIILLIPLVALAIDRVLFHIQKSLFPYRYGGAGHLNSLLRVILHLWDDIKTSIFPARTVLTPALAPSVSSTPTGTAPAPSQQDAKASDSQAPSAGTTAAPKP